MSIFALLAALVVSPIVHAGAAENCMRALVRGLHRVETESMARRRRARAAARADFAPLDARELRLVREIERRILPHFFVPGEIIERLFKDYAGPRDQFIARLESIKGWLTGLESGQVAPEGSVLHPFTEFKWELLADSGVRIHEVSWTSFRGHTGLLELPHIIPSGSMAEDAWPGSVPIFELIGNNQIPIEPFMGVIYPWPAIVLGRITEHHLIRTKLDRLASEARDDDDFGAILYAINHHVLEDMLVEYESLIADHPEFRSKHFDDILAQGSWEGIRQCLRRDYLRPSLKYVDVVKPPTKN